MVARFSLLLLDTRVLVQGFQRVICIFLISVLDGFGFGSISAPNQVEPKAMVLEPKLTGTLTAQNFRYQNTEVAVLSVLLVLAQNYFFIVFRIVPLITVRKYVRKP